MNEPNFFKILSDLLKAVLTEMSTIDAKQNALAGTMPRITASHDMVQGESKLRISLTFDYAPDGDEVVNEKAYTTEVDGSNLLAHLKNV